MATAVTNHFPNKRLFLCSGRYNIVKVVVCHCNLPTISCREQHVLFPYSVSDIQSWHIYLPLLKKDYRSTHTNTSNTDNEWRSYKVSRYHVVKTATELIGFPCIKLAWFNKIWILSHRRKPSNKPNLKDDLDEYIWRSDYPSDCPEAKPQ